MAFFRDIHFEISERKVLLRLFDLVAIFFGLHWLGRAFAFDYLVFSFERVEWLFFLTLYWSVFATIFELYELQSSSKLQITFKNTILATSVTVLLYLLTPYYTPVLPNNRLQIVLFYFGILAAVLLWRLIYINLISAPRFYKRVLLIADTPNIMSLIAGLDGSDPNYKLGGYINLSNSETPIPSVNKFDMENLTLTVAENGISEIIVALGQTNARLKDKDYVQLINLLESGFPIKEYTQVFEEINFRVPVNYIGKDFFKFFPFSRNNSNAFYLFVFRFFDIIAGVFGIVLLIAILPFVVVGNLIANRGVLFYSQNRIGKNGKAFKIYKLRTMYKNAEKNGAQYAQKHDSRVTKFGSFLRRTRIDEIPQFINILKGDMSLIGPRPERPVFVKELSQLYPFYETRHIVKPGLTGWAQVKGRYGSSHDYALEKLQYDLYYIKHRNVFLDLNILLKTVGAVLYYRGQ